MSDRRPDAFSMTPLRVESQRLIRKVSGWDLSTYRSNIVINGAIRPAAQAADAASEATRRDKRLVFQVRDNAGEATVAGFGGMGPLALKEWTCSLVMPLRPAPSFIAYWMTNG